MKKINYFLLLIPVLLLFASCDQINYRKTRSGLVFKLFPSKSKDSLLKIGQIARFNVTTSVNDSVVYNSTGKLPGYVKMQPSIAPQYNFTEILPMMKLGDSALIVQMADTLMNHGEQLPPFVKRGDKIKMTVKITAVYDNDSAAMKDYNAEMEKDKPRQLREQQAAMEKMQKDQVAQQIKEEEEFEKSGEAAREIQTMQEYLSAKKINAQKAGKGTFVLVKQKGNGPAADTGKFVTVKYTGKVLRTDSVFQSSSYTFKLGTHGVVSGWDEGLPLFNKGGNGVLYIPGFRAYAKTPPQGLNIKPFEALIFEVTVTDVSDTMPQPKPEITTPVKTPVKNKPKQ